MAGLIAGAYLAAVFTVQRVPDALVAALGGPVGVERDGGLVVSYRPPEGYDTARLERLLTRRGATIRRGDRLQIEIQGIGKAEAEEVAAMLSHGGLEFREVVEDVSLFKLPHERRGRDDFVAPGVRVDIDQWLPEGGGARHSDSYLSADDPRRLEAAFAQARADGWSPPLHTVVAFERLRPGGDGPPREHWRSYLVGDRALLDGDEVASAIPSTDPNTGRPMVLLDFTPSGGARFAEITARIVGHKLATLVGGEVKSAPVINGPIRGGRAVISMGGGDVVTQEREATALVAVLSVGALPAGGAVEGHRWVPPAAIDTQLALARLAIGLFGGAVIGLLVGGAIRLTRPVWQPGPRRAGRLPLGRVAVTLLAPVSLIALAQIGLPGVNEAKLFHTLAHGGGGHGSMRAFTVIALGVGPIVSAFVLVELASLAISRVRRVRMQPAARIAMGRYVAALGVILALVQSWLAISYLHRLQRPDDLVEIIAPGMASYLAAIASMTAGTMLLVIVAGVIRQHGLGNGYGVLIVSDWALTVVDRLLDDPSPGEKLGLAAFAAIGCATVAMLRMRVGDEREAPLRVPASGTAPLTTAGSVATAWTLLRFGLLAVAGGVAGGAVGATAAVLHGGWYLIAVLGALIGLVPLWSFAFSRPAIVAPLAAHTDLAPPGRESWRRATLLSLVMLALISAASLIAVGVDAGALLVCDAVAAMTAAAVVLDLRDDLRARSAGLVVAWPLQQAQHAEIVRRVLTDAGIACHLQSSHLRTLLAFFGPYVPIDVLVPAASADDARGKIGAMYHDVPARVFE